MYLVCIDKENDGCYEDYQHGCEIAGVYDSLDEAKEAIYRRWMKDVSQSVIINAFKGYIDYELYDYYRNEDNCCDLVIVRPLIEDEEDPMVFSWIYDTNNIDVYRWTYYAVIKEIELNKDLF